MMLSRRHILAGLAALALPRNAWAQGAAEAAIPAAPLAGFDADSVIAAANLGGDVAYVVTDAKSGAVLSSRGAAQMLAPASTLKVVTALYALDRLGPDHRFVTRIWRNGNDLILAGGGDPLLDSDGLARIAELTVPAWQGEPPARFLVWGGALPRMDRISPEQDEYLPYNPSLSGVILNFNRVHLGWRQGQMSLQARGAGQSPRAYTISISASERSAPLFTYDGSGRKEAWTIARRAIAKPGSRWLPVRRPELYAGDVFQTLCRAKGLVLPNPEVSDAPPAGTEIARLESPPLSEIVRGMLEYSNNLTAEVIGLSASGAGDPRASAQVMGEWLRAILPDGQFDLHDHSGLSGDNRLDAMTLTRLLTGAGQSRDLAHLLKHIPLRDAKGKRKESPIEVLAKTGTLNFVSNLAGYAQGPDGRVIAFTILSGDEARRAASEGREMPDGVVTWTRRSKAMQQALIEGWIASLPAQIAAPAEPAPESVLR